MTDEKSSSQEESNPTLPPNTPQEETSEPPVPPDPGPPIKKGI